MKKKILYGICAVVSISSLNVVAATNVFPVPVPKIHAQCTPLPVPSDVISAFCSIFPRSVGSCSGEPNPTVGQMYTTYRLMTGTATYNAAALEQACKEYAPIYHSPWQACYGQWTCYWEGGASKDMPGLCNGNGRSCATMP